MMGIGLCTYESSIVKALPAVMTQDMPKGDTAVPECALRTTTGDKYCGLVCRSDSDCGTGSCQTSLGVGLCTYAAADAAHPLQLLPAEAAQIIV
ncbi:unnamed protein product [Symbiodinium sp. CCMP2456]|nr:unnamed protein product [Symbiodinium sp. CCMP2456]